MKKIQDYKDLGVRELKVTNKEAVAVNPYEYRAYNPFHEKWYSVDNLPPLPCLSVKNGTYEIGRFKEEEQFELDGKWLKVNPNTENWFRNGGNQFRTVLVLSEQVEEKPEIIENPYFGDGEDAQTFDIIQFKQPDRDYLAVNQDREWVDHIDFDPAKDGKDTTAVGLFVCINGEWKLLGMVSKASFDCDIATLKSKLWRDNG